MGIYLGLNFACEGLIMKRGLVKRSLAIILSAVTMLSYVPSMGIYAEEMGSEEYTVAEESIETESASVTTIEGTEDNSETVTTESESLEEINTEADVIEVTSEDSTEELELSATSVAFDIKFNLSGDENVVAFYSDAMTSTPITELEINKTVSVKREGILQTISIPLYVETNSGYTVDKGTVSINEITDSNITRANKISVSGIDAASGRIRCNISIRVSDSYGTNYTGEVNVATMPVADYTLEIDAADANVETVLVEQGGETLSGVDGKYGVSNTSFVYTTIKCKPGYEPCIIAEEAGVKYLYTNQEIYDESENAYVVSYRPVCDEKYTIIARKMYQLTVMTGGLNFSLVDIFNNQFAIKSYMIDENSYPGIQITRNEETGNIVKAVLNVPEKCYIAFDSDMALQTAVASFSSSLANPIVKETMPTSADDAAEYTESIENAGKLCPLSLNKATTVYLGYVPVEKKVNIPEKVSVKYLNPKENNEINYAVADGGKTLKFYNNCTVKFQLTNTSGELVRVYKNYKDYEGNECREEINVTTDSDAFGNDIEYYAVGAEEFDSIDIERHPLVTVTFAPIHASFSFSTGEDSEATDNQYKVEMGVPIYFSADADEGYYIEYVSATGKKEDAISPDCEGGNGYYFTPQADATLVIKAVPEPDDLTVISDISANIVFINSEITPDDYNPGNYKVPYNVSKIDFRIITDKECTPDVRLRNSEGKMVEADAIRVEGSETESDKHILYYSIYADELGKETNYLIIAEKGASDTRTFTVTYKNEGAKSVVLKNAAGKTVQPVSSDSTDIEVGDNNYAATQDIYEVPYGELYSLTVTADDTYYAGKITVNEEAKVNTNTIVRTYNVKECDIDLTSYMNTSVEIIPYGQKKVVVKKEKLTKDDDSIIYDYDGNETGYTMISSGITYGEPIEAMTASQVSTRYALEGYNSYILNVTAAGSDLKIRNITNYRGDVDWDKAEDNVTSSQLRIVVENPDSGNAKYGTIYPEIIFDKKDNIPTIQITSRNVLGNRLMLEFEDGSSMTIFIDPKAVLSALKVIGSGISIDGRTGTNNNSLRLPVDRAVRMTVATNFYTKKVKDGTKYVNETVGSQKATVDNLDFRLEMSGGTTYNDCFDNTREYISADWYRKRIGTPSGVISISAGDVAGVSGDIVFFEKNTNKELARIHVTTEDAQIIGVTPAAQIKSTDDISATFEFSGNGYLPRCYEGKQYYRITARPKEIKNPSKLDAEIVAYVPIEYPEYPEEATEAQIDAIDKKFTQTYKMRLFKDDIVTGYGEECRFDFDIDVIQTKQRVTSADIDVLTSAGKECFYKGKTISLTGSTKDPVFETKVSVKKAKGASGVYTGQKDVLVGTAAFSKTTSCLAVSAFDMTYDADDQTIDERELVVRIVDDVNIYVDTQENTSLGTHTISVTPASVSGMYAQPVTFNVTVVKGIEKLEVVPASTTVLKKETAAPSLAVTVLYNDGDVAPKTKKVTYEIVDESGETVNPVYDADTASSALDGMLKMSGAKVLIDKSLDVTGGDVQFRVKVIAADYDGNRTEAVSDLITVSSAQLYIGSVKLVKWDREARAYNVIADSNTASSLTAAEIDGAAVVVLKKGAADIDSYDMDYIKSTQIGVTDYTIKSSNAKALSIVRDGDMNVVRCNGIAKNIKLTATTTDGGKQSKVLTVTSAYYMPEDLAVSITDVTGSEEYTITETVETKGIKREASFAGNTNTRLWFNVSDVNAENGVPFKSLANYSVTIAGGKIVDSNMLTGEFAFVVNSEKATITLINKALTAKDANYKKVYTVTNTAFVKTAGPSMKLVSALKSGDTKDQDAIISVKGTKSYDPTGKYVLIAVDEISAAVAKTANDYAIFGDAITNAENPIPIEEDGTFKISFDDTTLNAGTYKIAVTIGTYEDDVFTQDAKTITVPIKVAKPKANKGLLKFNTTYSMAKDKKTGEYPDSVAIKYTAKDLHSLKLVDTYNCNIKGVSNDFKDYFDVVETDDVNGIKSYEIQVIAAEDELEYLRSKAAVNDRQGYLIFEAELGDDGYGNPYKTEIVVKVTINM